GRARLPALEQRCQALVSLARARGDPIEIFRPLAPISCGIEEVVARHQDPLRADDAPGALDVQGVVTNHHEAGFERPPLTTPRLPVTSSEVEACHVSHAIR